MKVAFSPPDMGGGGNGRNLSDFPLWKDWLFIKN